MNLDGDVQHADRIFGAVDSDAAARSALVASWRRSMRLHHLDPTDRKPSERLSETELAQARERIETLIRVAQPILDRLFLAVGNVGCCVLLADREGVPVDRRGAEVDDETFRDWGLWPGAIWSELREGTNGIGTCLVERRPLTIHCDQHFFTRNTLLSCTSAPVFDHLGRLAAVVDVSSCRADQTKSFVDLIAVAVRDAARRIEAENFRCAFPKARIMLAPAGDAGVGGLIAVDADDLVVGATRATRLALGLAESALDKPLPAADLLGGAQSVSEHLATSERAALQRALARANGNVSAAAMQLGVSRATLHRKLKRFELR